MSKGLLSATTTTTIATTTNTVGMSISILCNNGLIAFKGAVAKMMKDLGSARNILAIETFDARNVRRESSRIGRRI